MANRIGVLVVLGALLMSCPAMGYAEEMDTSGAKFTLSLTSDYTASPWTQEVGYTNRAIGKLGFGVKNILLGWTELITEPKDAMNEGGNFFVGLAKGVKNGVFQTVGGVVHLVTFPITCLDAPLPEGGTQLI